MDTGLEYRRKTVHLITCVGIALLIILETPWWAFLIVAGSYPFLLLLRPWRPLAWIIAKLERPETRWTGIAGFWIFLSAALATLFFGTLPAAGGMAVLGIADAVAVWGGIAFGHVRIPWDKNKHLEGRILGVLMAAAAITAVAPFSRALLAAAIAMFVETVPHGPLDDNLTVPLVASLVLWV